MTLRRFSCATRKRPLRQDQQGGEGGKRTKQNGERKIELGRIKPDKLRTTPQRNHNQPARLFKKSAAGIFFRAALLPFKSLRTACSGELRPRTGSTGTGCKPRGGIALRELSRKSPERAGNGLLKRASNPRNALLRPLREACCSSRLFQNLPDHCRYFPAVTV